MSVPDRLETDSDRRFEGQGESIELAAIREELQRIYTDLQNELERLAPVCQISGRCCRFAEYDHTLFLSGIEMELLLADAPKSVSPWATDGSRCPWQDGRGRCTAREARPLGCRVFFCDPNYQDRMPEVAERFQRRLKAMVAQRGWRWDYRPLQAHLRALLDARRGPVGPDVDESIND